MDSIIHLSADIQKTDQMNPVSRKQESAAMPVTRPLLLAGGTF
jgi:hypothetical protein